MHDSALLWNVPAYSKEAVPYCFHATYHKETHMIFIFSSLLKVYKNDDFKTKFHNHFCSFSVLSDSLNQQEFEI